MNIINITADTRKKSTMLVPNVVQNDSLNVFVIKIQEDRQDVELDDNITYTLTSADGVIIKGDKTGSNEVTFNVPGSLLKETGTVQTSIQMYHEDGRMSTLEFSYNVVRDLTGEYIPSDPEKTLIEIVLVEGPKVIQDAKDATVDANDAVDKANDATVNANDGADRANTTSGLIEPLLVGEQARVSDSDVQAQLATLNATQSQIIEAMQTNNDNLLAMQERLDGTFDTRVTGSNVEDGLPVKLAGDNVYLIKTYFDATAILDTDLHNGGNAYSEELREYSSLFLKVYCTLGEAIVLRFYDAGAGFGNSRDRHIDIDSPKGIRIYDESTHVAFVTPGAVDLNIRAQATVAPEKGVLTVELYGKKMSGGVVNAETDPTSS